MKSLKIFFFYGVLFIAGIFLSSEVFAQPVVPPPATTNIAVQKLIDIPDTFWVPAATNKIEWSCPGALLGPAHGTNDVLYRVINIQSNRCGVFAVSYPVKYALNVPVIIERRQDQVNCWFSEIKFRKTSGYDIVESVVFARDATPIGSGERVTLFADINVGQIFYTGPGSIYFKPRISEAEFWLRRGGKP